MSSPAPYDGPERRQDSVSVRFALLEQGQQQAERRHAENKQSLEAVHKRLSEIKADLAKEVREGIAEVLARMDSKDEECKAHAERIVKNETTLTWVERWLGAAWAALAAGFVYLATGGRIK